ncbi:MAG: GatB/YqeY domain-containing protein [Candidatus Paceibacterota bacterium]
MSIHTELRTTLKEAMKAKDEVRLRTVRGIMTACTNELVATGKTPQDELDDAGTLSVIKRLAKQRKESIVQYEAAGRPELALPEKEELAVLEAYLPTLMSQDEIRPIAEAVKAELGITDKAKMGILVGAVMKKLQGKADGADVKAVVEELLK